MSNQSLITLLEKGVRDVLNSKDGVSTGDKLKAIECGAKLLMIRYRIEGSGEGEDGRFFTKDK